MPRSTENAKAGERPTGERPVRVTMRDVAQRAGVSQPLVSLVIGGNPNARVAESTRERILVAARELGYRPNVVAQALVRRRSYAIGLIIPDLRNPFFADVVSGAERVAAEEGYAVLFCDATEVSAERHVEALRARQIDGVIIDAMGAATIPPAVLAGLNVVLIDEPSADLLGVATDALGAGRLAAEHLIELGHRQIAFLGPASDVWAFRMRERGFLQGLRAAGLDIRPGDLRRAAPTVEGGRAAMQSALAQPARPTAVFCANDLMALGALKACAAAGVAVPADLSVMGCDDIETARLVTPELTTITVRARELGARAARLLLRSLNGEETRAARPLPVTLAARGTTGRAASRPTAAPEPRGSRATRSDP
jgi:LacI family transcriptional regulator